MSSLVRGTDESGRLVRLFARVPFVDGWSLAVLLWTLAFGIVVRVWRVVDAVWGTSQYGELTWIAKTIGVDIAFAIALWLALGALNAWSSRSSSPTHAKSILARALNVAVLGGVLFLGVANTLSFHISGSALTWQRLRGGDAVTMRDLNLIAWSDIWPVIALAICAAASLVIALVSSSRLERRVAKPNRARAVASVVVVGIVGYALYLVAWEGRDHGYGRHPVGILVESALQDVRSSSSSSSSNAAVDFTPPPPSEDGWRALMTPAHPATPPPPTPTRAQPDASVKNVIVFFSEGVPLEHTSLAENGPATTPKLKARTEANGLVLERFYSPYHRSIHALYSLFCGEFPPPTSVAITVLNPRIDCDEFSTAFARRGVKPALFHAGYFSFYDKGQFLNDRDYVVLEDATAFGQDEKYTRTPWGVDDRAMVERALEWIDTLSPDDRFALVLVPITAHYPFTVPPDVKTPFGDNRKIDRFWGSVYFLDLVFDELMQGLEKRGLLDDTLVMFTADHGESPHEPPRVTNVDRAAYEYNVRVPAVLFAPKMFSTPQTTARLGSIPDILPTLLDAAGFDDDAPQRQGASLLAGDWREKRVWLGAARSNVNLLGFLDGHEKVLLNLDTGRIEAYDLARDPDELDDVAGKRKESVDGWRRDILTYKQWQLDRIKTRKALDDGPDVHDLLANAFDVAVVDANGARAECTRDSSSTSAANAANASARICPGRAADFYPGVVSALIEERERRCLRVEAPAGARVELSARRDASAAHAPVNDALDRVSLYQVTSTTARLDHALRPGVVVSVDGKAIEGVGHGRHRRHPLPTPRESLTVTVDGAIVKEPVCLFFSARAWEPTVPADARAAP